MDKDTLETFSRCRVAILQDDSTTVGNAVMVVPAKSITAQEVNQLLTLSGGHIYVALSPARAREFSLQRMAEPRYGNWTSSLSSGTTLELCTSVEAREGVTTGISAADRAQTISLLGEDHPEPRKLVHPGHVFPVVARDGGVLVKNTLAEGALDLVSLVGKTEAAAFIDLLDSSGEFLNQEGQKKLADDIDCPLIPLSALIRYRLQTEQLVYKVAEARLPTRLAGEVRSCIYKSKIHDGEHLALIKGEIDSESAVLTRVQAESTFADVFGGPNPPTRNALQRSLRALGENESGVLIYLRSPDAGTLKEQVEDWQGRYPRRAASIMREYGLGAQILRDLGVRKIDLLTDSKKNLVGLQPFGLEIVSQSPLPELSESDLAKAEELS